MGIRKDGKFPKNLKNYFIFPYPNCNTDDEGAREYTARLTVPEAQKYQTQNIKVMKAYWKKELLDFIPVWQKGEREVLNAGRRRDPTMNDEPETNKSDATEPISQDQEEPESDDPVYHFSERYRNRLRIATNTPWHWG